MITYKDFARRGHKLLGRDEGIKEVKELFWRKFKEGYEKKDLELIGIYLLHLSEILFKPEEIFFDGVMYHRNKSKEEKVKNEFINFFLKEKVEDFFKLYSIVKSEPKYLYEYLPIVIRFTAEAKPEPTYFIALYLILADVLITVDKKNITDFKEKLINLSTKGFARYRVNLEIFDSIINEAYSNKAKDFKEEVKPYSSFMIYYSEILKDFEETLKIGRFNNEFAIFLIFSNFIFEDKKYKNLLEKIREKIKLDLIDELIKSFKLDINKERLKGNIKNVLTF